MSTNPLLEIAAAYWRRETEEATRLVEALKVSYVAVEGRCSCDGHGRGWFGLELARVGEPRTFGAAACVLYHRHHETGCGRRPNIVACT